jgi:hypothetical protein
MPTLDVCDQEAATLKETTAACECRKFTFRERSLFAMSRLIRVGSRLLLALVLLTCWGRQELRASTPELTQKLVSGRSARTIPHRFTIVPSAVSMTSNQTQHFGVTDAQGNSVAVHWNISGLHCAGLACGNIDADGNYSAPASLSQPLEITLEGVIVSDPNYSVMTRVQILPGVVPSPASAPASNTQISAAAQVPAAPVVEKIGLAPSHQLPMNQQAVAPAPMVASNPVRQQTQPLTNVIAAAPKVDVHPPTSAAGLLPLPTAVAAAPVVNASGNSDRQQMPPLPSAVAATPVVKEKKRNSGEGTILLDVPAAVSNLTVPKKQESKAQSVAAAPSTASVASPLPSTATAPQVVKSSPAPTKPQVLATTSVVARASAVATPSPVTVADLRPLPSTASAPPQVVKSSPAPIKAEVQPQSTALVASLAAPKQGATISATLPPLPATVSASAAGTSASTPAGVSAAPAATSASTPAGTVVTYRDGQLRIDAENTTLAAVLQLVATKMGAVIDVPPGAGEERIVEHVGPGHPNDVLTQLLNGSHLNFIIVNSPLHPNEPAEVLLSMQGSDTGTPSVAPPPQAPATSVLWTPPDPTLRPLPLPPRYDTSLTVPPKESLTPDSISELMRAKARELRERAQQEQGTPQPPPPPSEQAPPQ